MKLVSVMPWGHYFLNLSNEHRDELIAILTANPELCGDSVALLQQWEPLAEAVLSGRTANTTISTAQIDALEATIEAFRPLVSSSLTTDGESALALYEPLDQYAGMTIQDAVHDVLTARFSINLPLVTKPLSNRLLSSLQSEKPLAQQQLMTDTNPFVFEYLLTDGCGN